MTLMLLLLILISFAFWVLFTYSFTKDKNVRNNIKVEYHANENLLQNSEKIAYVGQRLMNPIKKRYLTMLFFLNAITFLGFDIKNSSF